MEPRKSGVTLGLWLFPSCSCWAGCSSSSARLARRCPGLPSELPAPTPVKAAEASAPLTTFLAQVRADLEK